MIRYATVDLETFGQTTYKRFCNPLDPAHYVVMTAYKYSDSEAQCDVDMKGIQREHILRQLVLDDVSLLIGQNFKFDMLWFWKCPKFRDFIRRGGMVWDTMLAEFLLRGQRGKAHGGKGEESLSLDALAVQYGGTVKDKDVSSVFKSGGTVLDIPQDKLVEYAKEDVNNTELVFKAQVARAKELGMLNIIKVYNNHLLAVTEMEHNGLYVNREKMFASGIKLRDRLAQIEEDLLQIVAVKTDWNLELIPFNVGSSQQLGVLLYGGELQARWQEPMLTEEGAPLMFKSGAKVGQPRLKWVETMLRFEGFGERCLPQWKTASGANGTGEDVLKEMRSKTNNETTKEVLTLVLEYRKLNKLKSTYIDALPGLIHGDERIHTEFNVVGTATGRLASANPNVQNLHPAVLEFIESQREGWSIMELDFSQLEVVIQAWITNCKTMIDDIRKGMDFHCLRLSYAEGISYEDTVKNCAESKEWSQKRKNAKVVSFQKAYGAHVKKISESTGLSEKIVEKIFNAETERYPEIEQFYESLTDSIDEVKLNKPLKIRRRGKTPLTSSKYPAIRGEFRTVTGKKYCTQKKAVLTKHGKVFEYWPGPEIQNYPIQGTAADIVSMQVGRVFRFLLNHEDKAMMINEVHDSLILEVDDNHKEFIVSEVEKIMNDVSGGFQKYLGINFDAPIKVDYGSGKTWEEAK